MIRVQTCLKLILSLLALQQVAFASDSVNNSAGATQGANTDASNAAQQVSNDLANQASDEFKKCKPNNPQPCDKGAMLSGMSMLSALQALANGSTADQAANTAADTTASDVSATPAAVTLDTLKATSGTALNSSVRAKLASGVNGNTANFKTNTITTANGKTYSASDFASAASMSAKGFSPDQISSALGAVKAAEAKAMAGKITPASASGSDDGGGGGGGSSSSLSESTPTGSTAGGRGPASKPSEDVANLSSKDYNGTPIGESGDSLFLMMNRRYKFKNNQNAFIDESELKLLPK